MYSSQQGAIDVCTCTVTNHYHKQMYIRYLATGVKLSTSKDWSSKEV